LIDDLALILLISILMRYANLIYYNTGKYVIFQGKSSLDISFTYHVPPSSAIATLVLYILAIITALFVKTKNNFKHFLAVLSVSAILLITGSIFYVTTFSKPTIKLFVQGGYTDAYVLQYEACKMFIFNGTNPYTADFSEYIRKFVPLYFRTFIWNDGQPVGIVTKIDYPAFSFLWYIPSVILGVDGIWQDLLALTFLMVFLTLACDNKTARLLIPLIFVVDWNLIFFTVGSVTDVPWVLLLCLTVLADRYAPIFLGLAVSYKAEAWMFTPYYLIFRKDDWKRVLTYTALTALAINGYFLITNPCEFIQNILLPLTANLQPGGVGLSGVLQAFGVEIGKWYSILTATAWIVTLIVYYKYRDIIGERGLVAFPLLICWLHFRSFQNYLIWWSVVYTAVIIGGGRSEKVDRVVDWILDRVRSCERVLRGWFWAGN